MFKTEIYLKPSIIRGPFPPELKSSGRLQLPYKCDYKACCSILRHLKDYPNSLPEVSLHQYFHLALLHLSCKGSGTANGFTSERRLQLTLVLLACTLTSLTQDKIPQQCELLRFSFQRKPTATFKERHPEKAGSEDKSLNGEPPSTLDTTTVFSYFQEKKMSTVKTTQVQTLLY